MFGYNVAQIETCEGAGVGDVAAHRGVPHREQCQRERQDRVRQGNADDLGDRERGRHPAGQYGHGRGCRDGEEDQAARTQPSSD